jgi:tripartite-type tricarboxylate transporter receptor subunit TctC
MTTHMTTRRRFLALSSAALVTPSLARTALADSPWPTARPIRAVCPFQAGSTVDVLGRLITDPLADAIHQSIVIENRGGAGGSIGSALVAKAEPDGYTLLINAAAHTAAPAAYPHISYDPARDFAGIAMIGVVPNVIVIAPSKGIKTLKELVARAQDGHMTYASAGVGSATHWGAERFRLSAGFKATHVPFRGGPAALTEVATGRVDFMTIGTGSGLPFIRDGRLVALAVTTQKRSAALPDVPTTLEFGYKDSDYTFWNGFLAPAKTPRPIVERLHSEISKVLATPDVKDKLAKQGVEPLPLTPDEFDALMRKEIAANLALAKAAGLKFN